MIQKKKSHAFGKDIYLLGKDETGILYWLESPSWDGEWYWGFGYVTNNKNPHLAKDIASHQHIDSSFLGDNNKKDGTYCHNLYESKLLEETTFNENEGWELSELFQQFYFLKQAAENFKRGKCHTANTTIMPWKKPELTEEINTTIIPQVTKRIIEILTPTNGRK